MGRADVARNGPLEPASYPDWVLSFPEPWISPDPVKQAARMVRFHRWQQERDAWFLEQGIVKSLRVCNEERRRRAAVWQEDHPEDAGR
jgi:hypothetical protein